MDKDSFLKKSKISKQYCRRCNNYVDALSIYPLNNNYYPVWICTRCTEKLGIVVEKNT